MLSHRILGSSLSISCPSLGSKLIVMAHTHIWRLLRWYSALCGHMGKDSPLLEHPKTMVSCLFAGPDFFPDSLLVSCCALAPLRLSSCSQPQSSPLGLTSKARASAPSPHSPWWVTRQASWLVSAGQHQSSVWKSLHYALCTTVAVLSSVAPQPPHLSPTVKGFPSVWKLFLLHSSLPGVQVPFLFFWLCFFFVLLP